MTHATSRPSVIIIGAGVSGLSCGVRLLEAGCRVRMIAGEFSPHLTSNVAAAVWYPYLAGPRDRVAAWGASTYQVLKEMAVTGVPGLAVIPYTELFREHVAEPTWAAMVPAFRRAMSHELPRGYQTGFIIDAPVTDTSIYMPWLNERFLALGGIQERRQLASLTDVAGCGEVIVNCSGLGARDLVVDESMFPVRGQIIRVRRPPGIHGGFSDEHHPRGVTYVIPRTRDCILGSTSQKGDWNTEPDPATARSILDTCVEIMPQLRGAEILEHRVGLRPGRPEVRLELERLNGASIIHNYGHGGAGFTLSWGCADEVTTLVLAASGSCGTATPPARR